MHTQFSTTQTSSSSLLANGLLFDTIPGGTKIDPPDNTGGGTSTPPPAPEPEEEEEERRS
jgi:hypothetical protein